MTLKRFTYIACILMAAAVAVHAEEYERVVLRVTGPGPKGQVMVDRGKRDGLAAGDRVEFFPREGGVYQGVVKLVDNRTALVSLRDRKFKPAPGTRGEVLLPKNRFADEEKEKPPAAKDPEPEAKETPKSKWRNKDEDWSPDMPLLSGMRPVRPMERDKQFRGLAWVIADVVSDFRDEFDDTIVRVGAEATLTNFFGWGGELEFIGEIDYLTETNDESGLDLLVREVSYTLGGHRFAPMRIQFGRFLHNGLTEFGYLDGVEWSRRRDNGHTYGVAVGFLPQPDEDFESFADFSIAGFYRYVSGPHERLVVTGGFQKTWHNGEADRDLLIGKIRFLPGNGWDMHATVLLDFYTGGDDIKGSGVGVTQAYLYAARRFQNGNGFDITIRHLEFPELLRNEFTPTILDAEIDDNRTDRGALSGWFWLTPFQRVHGFVAAWNDEDDTGGSAEVGFDWHDLFKRRSVASIVVFVNVSEFEDLGGVRVSYGEWFQNGRWDVLYEIQQHRFDGFPGDRDDLVQHRARGSASLILDPTWDVSAYVEVQIWDEEFTWSFGFTVQKRF